MTALGSPRYLELISQRAISSLLLRRDRRSTRRHHTEDGAGEGQPQGDVFGGNHLVRDERGEQHSHHAVEILPGL